MHQKSSERSVRAYIEFAGECAKYRGSVVVILGSYHFRGARMAWNGGEDIW